MIAILKYILLLTIRDRLYIGIFLALVVSFSLSIFFGSTALVEQQQMTSAFIAGSTRTILVIGMILFVCLNVGHAFENKEIDFIISKSISRECFVLSYLLGFFVAVFLIFIPINIIIFFIAKANIFGLFIWSLSLLFELMILIVFALLASLILKNSFSAILASFAFYLISRMMGIFVSAINLPSDFVQIKNHFLSSILKIMSVVFPRLDLFAQSKWLTYGVENQQLLKVIFLQSAIYIPLMIFMAFHDFKKKQF